MLSASSSCKWLKRYSGISCFFNLRAKVRQKREKVKVKSEKLKVKGEKVKCKVLKNRAKALKM
jgi:hypothetical protein